MLLIKASRGDCALIPSLGFWPLLLVINLLLNYKRPHNKKHLKYLLNKRLVCVYHGPVNIDLHVFSCSLLSLNRDVFLFAQGSWCSQAKFIEAFLSSCLFRYNQCPSFSKWRLAFSLSIHLFFHLQTDTFYLTLFNTRIQHYWY